MFNKHDIKRDAFMLKGGLASQGYDWWWHSFTARDAETGEEVPFFVEFFLCNPELEREEPVLGQLTWNKLHHIKPSYLMVKAGCWGKNKCQLHRFFSWNAVELHSEAPYEVKADDCLASETRLKGSISITEEEAKSHPEWMCDSGEMSWDLTVDKKIAFNVGYGAGKPFREAEAFEMYWHAEGMKSAFGGSIELNGRKYLVKPETSYGYADKNWGSNFTSPWVWLSSNCMKSRITGKQLNNSVFDIGGGRPKVFFVPLDRRLLSAFWYEGKEYEYNFSKLWTHVKTKFDCHETEDEIRWHVTQENRDSVMDTRIRCKKADMLLVNYEAPDGSKKHNRLWNGGNGFGIVKLYHKEKDGSLKLIDDIEVSHVGCEYGEYEEKVKEKHFRFQI